MGKSKFDKWFEITMIVVAVAAFILGVLKAFTWEPFDAAGMFLVFYMCDRELKDMKNW